MSSNASWQLRPALERDVDVLLAIDHAQFPEPWTRGMIRDEIRQTDTRYYLVAEEDGRIVGYAGAMFVLDEMHVNTLAAAPGEEGRGVGADLLRALLAETRRRGIRKATLEVAASNLRAQQLYTRFGFAPVGVRRRYYERTGEDALILWAELEPLLG